MFTLEENDLEGRDYRSEANGIDYDEALREGVRGHIDAHSRSVRDVALSLRVDENWLQRWLDGDEKGPIDVLSAMCANSDMTPGDILSYSPTYAQEGGEVTPFKDLLMKRLVQSWTEDDIRQALMVANMVMAVPSAREGIVQGVKLAMRIAETFGYDTTKVGRQLSRVKDFTYQTGIGAGKVRDLNGNSAQT